MPSSLAKLQYPADLNEENLDYVSFSYAPYVPNYAAKSQGTFKGKSGSYAPPKGAILLYMPESTPAMAYNNTWNAKTFVGPAGKAARDLILRGDVAGAAGNAGGAAQQVVEGGIAGMMDVSANQQKALKEGKVYNPNVELLYDAPQLREFSFNFNFTPRTRAEAASVREIIRTFKLWSAPGGSSGAAMFEVPYLWTVRYRDEGMMGKFKPAACVGITHQANANSAYHATLSDGMPVQYSLALNFKEVDILVREDFVSAGANTVGF